MDVVGTRTGFRAQLTTNQTVSWLGGVVPGV